MRTAVIGNPGKKFHDMENLSEILSTLRQQQGLTIRDLSAETGINIANLSLIETGKRIPRIDTLAKILSALGADLIIRKKVGE